MLEWGAVGQLHLPDAYLHDSSDSAKSNNCSKVKTFIAIATAFVGDVMHSSDV